MKLRRFCILLIVFCSAQPTSGFGFELKLDSQSQAHLLHIAHSVAVAGIGLISFYAGTALMRNATQMPDFSTNNYFGTLTVQGNVPANAVCKPSDADPLLRPKFYWGIGAGCFCMSLGIWFVLRCSQIVKRFG